MQLRMTALAYLAALALAVSCGAPTCLANDPWGAQVNKPDEQTKKKAPQKKQAKRKPASKKPAKQSSKGRLSLTGDRTATMARVEIDASAKVRVFTLPNPYRVIVELTGTRIQAPSNPKSTGHGLVQQYHSGLFEAGKSRIVMETLGPVKATQFPFADSGSGAKILEVALTPIPVTEFGKGTGSAPPVTAQPDVTGLPGGAAKAPGTKPVVVIDPGHGGIDPGAVGDKNMLEKSIVMAVGAKLEKVLKNRKRYTVHLTRRKDVFVSLDQRLKFSHDKQADLFVSLHADSIEQSSWATKISGATVYTLSEKASDEQARLMAEKENASDLLAGLPTTTTENDEVRSILIDLMKRETATFSTEFARSVRSNLKKSVKLSRRPMRSAAFKVLKQTNTPSVLVELGYISNPTDAKRLSSPEWQLKVASSIANAVDSYFSKRTARAK